MSRFTDRLADLWQRLQLVTHRLWARPDAPPGNAWAIGPRPAASSSAAARRREARPAGDPLDGVEAMIAEMLADGRHALLLHPRIAPSLPSSALAECRERLHEEMTLVPAGPVRIGEAVGHDSSAPRSSLVNVEALLLDRDAVTNRQYRQFVQGGGYENVGLWAPGVWPAVLDFVDRSGRPGPRSWCDGQPPRGADDHPVTGVCWFEAQAYARWVGKRLPADAEWVKAAAWPVPTGRDGVSQRKYPWGDLFDPTQCNVWSTGPGMTVPVQSYGAAAGVCGARQLVGNVWEWTASDFGAGQTWGGDVVLDEPMKALRGGAYDTYFENQAAVDFQSGDVLLARKHNVGFRCAASLCDVAASDASTEPAETST
jgi:iron(II)-dependent oxidoreductase